MDISFSKNLYDSDGDQFSENCILLHIDNNLILKVKDVEEIRDMINTLVKIAKEIDG